MAYYYKLGDIPHKRHTQFRKPTGGLYREEVMGLEGFHGVQSVLYHHFLPPRVLRTEYLGDARVVYTDYGAVRHRAFATANVPAGDDPVSARRTLLGNADVTLGVSRATQSMRYFYRNAQAYEVWFVHEGAGVLRTQFGRLDFGSGDYLVIPYGVTWQMALSTPEARFFIIESRSQVAPPKRYRNAFGQLLEHAPYCERDIRPPSALETYTERGEFEVRVKVRDGISRHCLDHHPFDVVGWDGYLYPWAFSIHDFEPITGRVHQPPPAHQTFEAHNFVVCSFVPRLFDYHPLAIPAPYAHSNVNSDEVIYYCDGNFMSRKGIAKYDITLHPSGLPHGPQPGMTEASIGAKETQELAVMVDTFNPLHVAIPALELEKPDYQATWLEGSGE
ncbi:MAG: homogentisate 1,2-dioxygenase [Chloroflexi bacterium]|jgi:homogentisate 1,2-dioxygenase|uniref:Homogentisate 1,2-dioxygenase n=1 Tax=Candidatus Thermofonsia Clade 3 bacterium TaxID=2364212 RepID=A0A2M8QDM3_9CHLR|nr:homogentisate 1,2-dioxygenase [Candidatus Roseilinea sp. NK_OTU-006]PJF47915.1 MAG: homogentisate 1,2-dioxygenase [Candidatus Thermofonsia Clade 3 bacterium]RMG64351.1 MAG: homogentisate 1,2-dioxygenase [Chloroflexota bacterium]